MLSIRVHHNFLPSPKSFPSVKNLGTSPRGTKKEIAFSAFVASLRGIKPVYPAKKAGLVPLAALNSLQSNFSRQRFTHKFTIIVFSIFSVSCSTSYNTNINKRSHLIQSKIPVKTEKPIAFDLQ